MTLTNAILGGSALAIICLFSNIYVELQDIKDQLSRIADALDGEGRK